MKKLYYLIILTVILGLTLTGCTLLSNIGQVPTSEQSGITYLTKGSSPSLVGLWHLDELSGATASDSSGNGNTGTLVNDPQWVAGKFGNALSFSSVSENYVEVTNDTELNPANITVEAWVNLSSFTSRPCIVGKGTGSIGAYYLVVETSGKVRLWYTLSTGNWHYVESTITLSTNTWYHLAGTYDGTDAKVYINGVEEGKKYDPGSLRMTDSNNVFIGCGPNAGYGFSDGIIDEVRIWNTALTANQIQQSMASPLPVIVTTSRSEPDSVAVNVKEYWDITITVCNYDADNNPTDVVVQGGIGADLVVTEVNSTPIDPPVVKGTPFLGSDFTLTKKGGKMGATIVRGDIETLVSGNCFTLDLVIETGLNPKLKQEFTSAEEDHELDGGFSATYLYNGIEYKTPETEPLTVDVVE
jgi:hypothetical protein